MPRKQRINTGTGSEVCFLVLRLRCLSPSCRAALLVCAHHEQRTSFLSTCQGSGRTPTLFNAVLPENALLLRKCLRYFVGFHCPLLRLAKSNETEYAIAKRSGVSQSVVNRFVHGERGISLETAAKLCAYLKLDLR